MISFEEFEALAHGASVIPLMRPMFADMHTPVSTYLTLRDGSNASFLFESVEPDEKIGRFSFVGVNPVLMIRARGRDVDVSGEGLTSARYDNIFDASSAILSQYRFPENTGLTGFVGGLVGFIGYNTVSHLETRVPLPIPRIDEEDDAILGLFSGVVRFDHRLQLITIIQNVLVDPHRPLREQYETGRKALEAIDLRLRRSTVATQSFSCKPAVLDDGDRERFCDSVRKAKDHIVEGDIFQAVLSRRVHVKFTGDPFPVYRALRMINPSPYLFFVDFGETRLIGSSPEVLLRVQDRIVEVFPIAGTRKRGANDAEDLQLEQDLLSDEKELAEHVMLVDLGRNDVGRVSEYGTVEVPVLKRVERYSHVMHIVSIVRGVLRNELTSLDALKACFPAGTVSGAPKVRAMEIIDTLEGARRGAYAGAVGYIGFNGSLDTCIAIRTIIAHRDRLSIQSGAGIVADSIPENEYEETVNKARALLEAVEIAANGLKGMRI